MFLNKKIFDIRVNIIKLFIKSIIACKDISIILIILINNILYFKKVILTIN